MKLVRVASYKSTYTVLEYSDGVKVYGYIRGYMQPRVWVQMPGGKPMNADEILQLPVDLIRLYSDTRDFSEVCVTQWLHKFKGHGLVAMTKEEKFFFDNNRRQKIVSRWGLYAQKRQVTLIAVLKAKWRDFPGGRFLWIKIAKNTEDNYRTTNGYGGGWDLTDPALEPIAMAGVGTEFGRLVFRFNGQWYSRVSRHQVQGRSPSSYTPYYQKHPSPWQAGSAYMALKPFTGDFIQFKDPLS